MPPPNIKHNATRIRRDVGSRAAFVLGRSLRTTSGIGTEVSGVGGAGAVVWVEWIGRSDGSRERRERERKTVAGVPQRSTKTVAITDQPGLPNVNPRVGVGRMLGLHGAHQVGHPVALVPKLRSDGQTRIANAGMRFELHAPGSCS